MFSSSPFQLASFFDKNFYIKRDDLLSRDFSGNKARKFYHSLTHDFPCVKRVVSSGSNQSNAMYSLSVLAKMKEWEFVYICDHIPSFLKENPVGNYKEALKNGMKIFESKDRGEEVLKWVDESSVHIEEGGRQKEAEDGVALLAQELIADVATHNVKNPYLFLPSGVGTTALFLQKHLPFKVYTCATVGSKEYLQEQWRMVEPNLKRYPTILEGRKKYHYGKLYPELFLLWSEIKDVMGIEFDLLYDPVGWSIFLENIDQLEGSPIYLHQGGLLGNVSMLERYKRKMAML